MKKKEARKELLLWDYIVYLIQSYGNQCVFDYFNNKHNIRKSIFAILQFLMNADDYLTILGDAELHLSEMIIITPIK